MYTDWIVVRRLAAELDAAARSARVRDVGITSDGRLALRVRARGAGGDALIVDAFGNMPVVTLEHGIASVPQAGWPRAIADAIAGMRIERVRARRGDRVLAIDLATTSRFGVLSAYRRVAELVPRFGNVLLLKGDLIVAAAREFGLAKNPRRPIEVGAAYVPPPLPEQTLSRTDAVRALEQALHDPGDGTAAAVRALRTNVPLLPQMVAASLLAENSAMPAAALLDRAERVVDEAGRDDGETRPVHVYRDGGRIVQAHPLALAQFDALEHGLAESLSEVVVEAATRAHATAAQHSADNRRSSLLDSVRRRRDGLARDLEGLERALQTEPPDRLRREGDMLYAHYAAVPPGAASFDVPGESMTIALDPELDAKANAAAIFKRYRKAVGRLKHAKTRGEELKAKIAAADELAWEIERADAAALDEVADHAELLGERKTGGKTFAQPRRSALEVTLAPDARAIVGRSPRNNAEVTFRIARPDDLWFHARGVPGAHVVLRIDSARAPTSAELRSAAELAAFHSKARTSGIVPVDYTPRKFVRKQQNALPGLVWYTNAKTIDVTPRSL